MEISYNYRINNNNWWSNLTCKGKDCYHNNPNSYKRFSKYNSHYNKSSNHNWNKFSRILLHPCLWKFKLMPKNRGSLSHNYNLLNKHLAHQTRVLCHLKNKDNENEIKNYFKLINYNRIIIFFRSWIHKLFNYHNLKCSNSYQNRKRRNSKDWRLYLHIKETVSKIFT